MSHNSPLGLICSPQFWLPLLMILCLSGCGDALKLERPDPQKAYFVLAPDTGAQTPSAGPGTGILSLKPLNIVPSFNSREFVYRLQDDQYARDYYNLLLTDPTSQFTQCIRNWLNRSGVFQYVVNANSELEPTYVLETSIREFYGDFRNYASPSAVLDLQIFLLQEQDYEYHVIYAKEFHKVISITACTPEALVKGYNTALTEILLDLENDLRPLVKKTS